MDLKNIKKEYSNGEITIVWQSAKCIHCANCMNDNSEVFQPQSAPWIKVNAATTEELMTTVDKCPTGAISHYKN